MTEFADWRGEEEFSLAVARVTHLLCGLQLKKFKASKSPLIPILLNITIT